MYGLSAARPAHRAYGAPAHPHRDARAAEGVATCQRVRRHHDVPAYATLAVGSHASGCVLQRRGGARLEHRQRGQLWHCRWRSHHSLSRRRSRCSLRSRHILEAACSGGAWRCNRLVFGNGGEVAQCSHASRRAARRRRHVRVGTAPAQQSSPSVGHSYHHRQAGDLGQSPGKGLPVPYQVSMVRDSVAVTGALSTERSLMT